MIKGKGGRRTYVVTDPGEAAWRTEDVTARDGCCGSDAIANAKANDQMRGQLREVRLTEWTCI